MTRTARPPGPGGGSAGPHAGTAASTVGNLGRRRGVGRNVTWSLRAVLGPVLVGAVALTGCAAPADSSVVTVNSIGDGTGSRYLGTGIDEPYRLPQATWTDTSGATVTWPGAGLPEPVTVVFFAYTNCPDVCSTQLADLTQAIRASEPEVQQRTAVVVVTVDPARDDAQTLRAYLDGFDKTLPRRYVGLRSEDTAMIERVAQSLGVALTGREDGGGAVKGYEVGHGAQLIGFGPDGRAPVIWMPGTPVGDIRADLATLQQAG